MSNTNTQGVDAIVAAALQAAHNVAQPAAEQVNEAAPPAVYTSPAAAPAVYTPAPAMVPMSLEDIGATARERPVGYIKTKYEGLYVGDDKMAIDDEVGLKVRLRGSDVSTYMAISYGVPAKYGRCYNGTTEQGSGMPWLAFCQQAQSITQKAKPYHAADLVFELVEDYEIQRGESKGKKIPAGSLLGYSTSDSAFRDFSLFVKKVILPFGQDVLLEGRIRNGPINANGNQWGVIDFGKGNNFSDWTAVE